MLKHLPDAMSAPKTSKRLLIRKACPVCGGTHSGKGRQCTACYRLLKRVADRIDSTFASSIKQMGAEHLKRLRAELAKPLSEKEQQDRREAKKRKTEHGCAPRWLYFGLHQAGA